MTMLKLAILPVLISLAWADFPFDRDLSDDFTSEIESLSDNTYRLPEGLDPVHYTIEITPYFEATEYRESFTFEGVVDIEIKALVDEITIITIQENVREINDVTLTDKSGDIVPLEILNPFQRIRQYQFLRINLRDGVTLTKDENYFLHITYIGNINETPLTRGVFRGSYKNTDTGITHWYAATHLQPTHARQAFPSFDEPGYKATHTIIIYRPQSFTDTFSNMPRKDRIEQGDRVKEIFETTPRMSAYLVSFHISEEFAVIASNNDDERPYRILARPDARGQGEYALKVGVALTKWLEDYFDIPYYTMGASMKNDQLASPDWASGATENWGLVTYREFRLLYEENETNSLDKMSIATITSHELAHKWFGNLITAKWWDNVWINEGFASYFEYFATNEVERDLDLENQFNIMYIQSALSTDSGTNTRALQHSVNSPNEVSNHFSGISYSKGATLLMMLRHFLTPNTFQKALRMFLNDRSLENAVPEHIYEAFAKAVEEDDALSSFPELDIGEFLRVWVNEPGYPVLNVNVDVAGNRIVVEQERFFISETAEPTEQIWPLPLTYTSQSNPDWNNRKADHVITERSYTIEETLADEWTIFNIKQNAMYRVNYNEHNWELISDTLQQNPSSIDPLNRAQIVDDIFAFMQSGRMTFSTGFTVLQFLRNETNYYVWYPAISGFGWIRNRLLHLPDKLTEFQAVLHEYLNSVVEDLGYDEKEEEVLTTKLNRFYVMAFACNNGYEGCINHAVETIKNGFSVNPNLRRHVYCRGLLANNYNTWKELYERRQASNNQADGAVMLRALGCTPNDQAAQEYLQMILTSDVRAQDRNNAFSFLLMGRPENARVVLEFLKTHHSEIRDAVIGSARFGTVLSTLASYLNSEVLDDMEEWLLGNTAEVPEFNTGLNAINNARNNIAYGTRRADEIIKAMRDSSTAILPATLLLLVSLMIHLFK